MNEENRMAIELLSDSALLRVKQLVNQKGQPPGLLNVAKGTLYRMLAAGEFPAPVRPLPGMVAWRAGDVRAWLESHAKAPAPGWKAPSTGTTTGARR